MTFMYARNSDLHACPTGTYKVHVLFSILRKVLAGKNSFILGHLHQKSGHVAAKVLDLMALLSLH